MELACWIREKEEDKDLFSPFRMLEWFKSQFIFRLNSNEEKSNSFCSYRRLPRFSHLNLFVWRILLHLLSPAVRRRSVEVISVLQLWLVGRHAVAAVDGVEGAGVGHVDVVADQKRLAVGQEAEEVVDVAAVAAVRAVEDVGVVVASGLDFGGGVNGGGGPRGNGLEVAKAIGGTVPAIKREKTFLSLSQTKIKFISFLLSPSPT